MPVTRTVDGETRTWNGSAWIPLPQSDTADNGPQGPAWMRAAGGFLGASPLNPVNAINALRHPLDTLKSMFIDPAQSADVAKQKFDEAVTGHDVQGNEIPSRLGALEEMITNGVGAIPVVGPSILGVADRFSKGDVAGGLGAATGMASGGYLPDVPKGVGAVGRGVERTGDFMVKARVPQIGMAEAAFRGDPKGAVLAASPYALQYGGRGLQRLSNAMQGLGRSDEIPTGALPTITDQGNVATPKQLRPARLGREVPMAPEGGWGEPAKPVLPNHAAAEATNLQHNASFGEGAVIPSQMGPIESLNALTDPGTEHGVYNSALDMVLPRVPKFEYEAGSADRPGISIGQLEDGRPLPDQASAVQQPTPAADPAPSVSSGPASLDALDNPAPTPSRFRTMPRGDEFWGPGSTNRQGAPAQAEGGSANLLYDPQTDSGYLREQLQNATDPAERDFLARALAQRYLVGRGMMPR